MNAPMTPLRTEAENALVAAFGAARPELAGGAAVAQRRDEALGDLPAIGSAASAHRGLALYRSACGLREVLALAEAPSAATIEDVRLSLDAAAPRISGAEAVRLVLVDGVYVPALSDSAKLPAGVVVRTLADALAQSDPPSLEALPEGALGSDDAALALNAAFMNGGLVIDVAQGTRVERPLELVSIASEARPQSFFARSLVRLGSGAALTLVETHAGEGGTRSRRTMRSFSICAERAEIDHVATFSSTSVDSIHVSTLVARLGERARLTSFALVTGAGLLRRQGFLRFEGVHAKASLAGVGLLRGRQHADTTLVVHHLAPHCESREFFRHILDGEATGVFQGKVVVAPGAQKTDGVMKSQAILLSDRCDDEQQAGTGNLRRRCRVWTWRDVRRARCRPGLLCPVARACRGRRPKRCCSKPSPQRRSIASTACRCTTCCVDRIRRVARRAEFLMDTQAAALDVMKLRQDFPILAERPYGKPLVYLDNAASAQKPKAVIDRLVHAYEHEYANVHRGLHYLANAATEAYRSRARNGARLPQRRARPRRSSSRGRRRNRSISSPRPSVSPISAQGDEIVLSVMEHHSNIVPWHFHRERKGAVLKWVDVDDEGNFDLDAFQRALGPKTKIVADHPYVERARHGHSGQGDRPARARTRHSGSRRRLAGRRASRGRCARSRCRFLCLHRP